MAGTNSERQLLAEGPVIILVEPQMGENIGMVARAMANFGLADLRLVNPRDGWPNEKAQAAASKADHVIEGTKVYDTLEEAIADLNFVYATTARSRDNYKPVRSPVFAAVKPAQPVPGRRGHRHPVRPRALGADERGSGACRRDRHLPGQSRLCLAEHRPGRAVDVL